VRLKEYHSITYSSEIYCSNAIKIKRSETHYEVPVEHSNKCAWMELKQEENMCDL